MHSKYIVDLSLKMDPGWQTCCIFRWRNVSYPTREVSFVSLRRGSVAGNWITIAKLQSKTEARLKTTATRNPTPLAAIWCPGSAKFDNAHQVAH